MESVRNSEETTCIQKLIVLRNFQYWHKRFVVCLISSMSCLILLLLKDVFEGFGHRSLKLNHFKRNSQYLNLGLFEAIFIRILVEYTDKLILRYSP